VPKTRSSAAPVRGADARRLTTAALLAALLAVSAFVALPIPPVPVTLQVFVVVLVALLVPPSAAALAVGTYLLVGAVGLPVFAHATGGIGVLVGPTGGYLFGFLAGAVAGAWIRTRFEETVGSRLAADVFAAATVIAVVYAFGWAQLALVTHTGALAALIAGVAPFIVPDAVKAVAAVAVAGAIRSRATFAGSRQPS
jgi:biotin transport system substrate-specific component